MPPHTRASLIAVLIAAVYSVPAQAQGVGQVMFVSGQVSQQLPDGSQQPVTVGQDIQPGTRYITADGGYLHLRMSDDAYYSLRPNSRFVIEEYSWQPDQPSHNRIRTQLEQGSVRAITGRAGEANKQGYRLNTPVAAIGIRGTDYITHHTQDATRVAVSSGAVVISPFNDSCTATGVGACAGDTALLLAANTTGDYVEVRRNQRMPERKQDGWAPQASTTGTAPDTASAAPASAGTTADNRVTAQTAASPVPTLPAKPQEPSAFQWGRWSSPETTALLADPAWRLQAGNVGYLLLQQADTQATGYPQQTQATFALSASQAGFRQHDGNWQPASVSGGSLGINFVQGTFQTQLAGTRAEQPWQLNAAGAIQPNGALVANPARTDANTLVNGAITASASQAAYAFDKRYPDGALVGITHWRNTAP